MTRPLPATLPAPLTTTGLLVVAAGDEAPVDLVVKISTGGTVTGLLAWTLGTTDGPKLPVVVDSSPSSSSVGCAPAVAVVDVRSVVTGAPVVTGQTVVPTETSDVVMSAGQLVDTDGGHDVMV